MGTEGTYFNIIKVICDKPAANTLKGKKWRAFLLRSGEGKGAYSCHYYSISFGKS